MGWRTQSKRSRTFRRPLLSVARFRKHSLATTLAIVILAIGLFGLLILLWVEFTDPELLESAAAQSALEAANVCGALGRLSNKLSNSC